VSVSALHVSAFLPSFPRSGFAARSSRALRRIGRMRALTPDRLAHTAQVSPLNALCLPNIPPSTTQCSRTSLLQSLQRVRSGPSPVPGFATNEQARRYTPPKQVRYPAGCSFASDCSPPRLTATQLSSASRVVTSHGTDSHCADKTPSRTHSFPRKREPSKRASTRAKSHLTTWTCGGWVPAFAGMTKKDGL
jgi:hypothetical protein